MGVRGDLRLLERAVRHRWNIDRQRTIEVVQKCLESADERIAVRAASILVQMEAQNQKDELSQANDFTRRLLELATRFNIDLSRIGAVEASAASAIGGDVGADATEAERS